MAKQPTQEELLKAAIWSQLSRVYTSIPCTIVTIHTNLEEQRVDVQPSINLLKDDGTVEPRGVILNVPVMFPSSSTSAITFPLNVGDTVACFFSMRAMEVFNESDGKPSTPDNYAKFNQKDAYCIPGLQTRRASVNNPSNHVLPHDTKDLVVTHNIGTANEVEIRFKPNGDMIVTSPSKVEVKCKTAVISATTSLSVTAPNSTWNGNINLNGNITQSGNQTVTGNIVATEVTASGKALSTHKHGGVVSGGAQTGTPV